MTSQTITEISVTPVPAFRRKELGKNAYGENIGSSRLEWLVRAKTDGGLEGLTIADRFMRDFTDFKSRAGTVEGLVNMLREVFLGHRVDDFLEASGSVVTGVKPNTESIFKANGWMSILAYDLLAKEMGVSCIDILGGRKRDRVDAYDTTLYFQDLLNPEKGASQVADEAKQAREAGYRQLKIKVGRGGRWMMPEDGMKRDIEVVQAVREAVGPDFRIMVDANFGYDGHLDLLENFIKETQPADVYWLEEMVTASVDDYRAMREMQSKLGSDALLVCGEVDRQPISPVFQELISERLIDGYQPDIVGAGFSGWQDIERKLDGTGVRCIPHNFNNGNFGARADLIAGAALETFVSLEDERYLPSVYRADGFLFKEGSYVVVDAPGLGLEVDEEVFRRVHARDEIKINA